MASTTMTVDALGAPRGHSDRNWDSLQFRVLFAILLPIHLLAALGARLTPNFWRAGRPRRFALLEALDAAGTTARLAFSG